MNKDILISELLGAICGDGHVHRIQNRITLVGSLEDQLYYRTSLFPIIKKLFSKKLTIRYRNDRNACYFDFGDKEIFHLLVQSTGLHRGSKKNASVPEFILKNKQRMISFLRGLFDTDGCLKFSKQSRNVHYYPRIQISLQESPLANEIPNLLKKLGFIFSSWEDNRVNCQKVFMLSGKKQCNDWFSLIQPANPVHTSKYLVWKKQGFYVPKSTLFDRLEIIKEAII